MTKHLDAARVHQAANESFPPRHVLDLVQVERDAGVFVKAWEPTSVLLDEPGEVGDRKAGEPLVLEQQQ